MSGEGDSTRRVTRDPWAKLGAHTMARIALGRTGSSLPTRELLDFELAHAQARDAVKAEMDCKALAARMTALGLETVVVASQAADRLTYLRRPDLGRRLDSGSLAALGAAAAPCDLVLVLGDGLSAAAVSAFAPEVVAGLLQPIRRLGLKLGPVVLARGARVALGDEVGAVLGSQMVAVLIGERPGLSAARSLGIYLTYEPRPGRTDAERNCISNVRDGGLAPDLAAANLAWLVEAAMKLKVTGVALKDGSDAAGVLSPQAAGSIGHDVAPADATLAQED